MSLAEIIHVHGGRLLNPFPACLAAQNKIVAVQLMQAAGVPTPRSWVAADRNLLRSPVEEQPVIMKPYNGGRGIGIRVMRSSRELTNAPWPAEPVLIQEYIPEYDEVKVYVIGEDVFGIRTHSRSGDARRWPCGISDEVREIARHYLAQVTLTLARAGKTIQVHDDALELIVTKGYNIAFGARFLKRLIDEQIKLPISTRWKEGSHFVVKAVAGEVVVEAAPAHLVSAADVMEFGDVA